MNQPFICPLFKETERVLSSLLEVKVYFHWTRTISLYHMAKHCPLKHWRLKNTTVPFLCTTPQDSENKRWIPPQLYTTLQNCGHKSIHWTRKFLCTTPQNIQVSVEPRHHFVRNWLSAHCVFRRQSLPDKHVWTTSTKRPNLSQCTFTPHYN